MAGPSRSREVSLVVQQGSARTSDEIAIGISRMIVREIAYSKLNFPKNGCTYHLP